MRLVLESWSWGGFGNGIG